MRHAATAMFWVACLGLSFTVASVPVSAQTQSTPTPNSATTKRTTSGTSGSRTYGPAPVSSNVGGMAAPGASPRAAGQSQLSGQGAGAGKTPARTTAAPQGAGFNTQGGTPSGTPGGAGGDLGGNPALNQPALSQPVLRQATPGAFAMPQAPKWIPLPPDHEKYLDQVLGYWQESSGKIKRYRCKFTRWEYDGVFMARDPKTGEMPAKTQSTGVIKYAAPDKGLFKVEQMLHYTAAQKPGERAQYLTRPEDRGEQWICDGKSVFAFDHQRKQLMQTELPPDMQGRAIVDGPLPFMFGAEAAKIKQRFWIRVITPKDSKGEYWLEAVPKSRTDAANFKMLHIIIDETDFLPKAMALFDRNYDEVRNPTCTNFVFEKREVNWNETIDKINIFAREFWEPATPLGYKKVVERYAPATEERISAPAAGTKQATRPGPTKKQ